jgi:hypothetical protein
MPAIGQLDVVFGRDLGFLLERVQHIDGIAQSGCVDHSKSA